MTPRPRVDVEVTPSDVADVPWILAHVGGQEPLVLTPAEAADLAQLLADAVGDGVAESTRAGQ